MNPTNNRNNDNNNNFDEAGNLRKRLDDEKERRLIIEEKLKRSIADYNNLERQTKLNVSNQVEQKLDVFMIDFLQIYDDLERAKNVLNEEHVNVKGLDSIIKNIEILLSKYKVKVIDALGEIFDPHLHEAIKVIEDKELDENTIVHEIRKGYISHNRVIKPSIVIISKKSKCE